MNNLAELLRLLWGFLRVHPLSSYLSLAPWHLITILAVLGLLAALGLHQLLGHWLGFYHRRGRATRWIAAPTLVVYMVSVQVLLAAYGLGVRAPALVSVSLESETPRAMGELLLAPAFAAAPLAAQPESGVEQSALIAAIRSHSDLEYRDALRAEGNAATALLDPGRETPPTPSEILVQVGLHWIATNEAPPPVPQPASEEGATVVAPPPEAVRLPDFLATLVHEVRPGLPLARMDWEHVAGTRYLEDVLLPVMEEYLTYLAAALATLVVLFNLFYAYIVRRVKRIGLTGGAKLTPGAKPAGQDAAASGATPGDGAQAAALAPALAGQGVPAVLAAEAATGEDEGSAAESAHPEASGASSASAIADDPSTRGVETAGESDAAAASTNATSATVDGGADGGVKSRGWLTRLRGRK